MSLPLLVFTLITLVLTTLSISLVKDRYFIFKFYKARLTWGVFVLCYFLFLRTIPRLFYFASHYSLLTKDHNARSFYLSKIFMLDICPFYHVTSALALCFDKNMKYSKYWAFVVIFTGLIGVIAVPFTEAAATLNFKYIFIGSTKYKMYWMLHFLLFINGLIILKSTKNWNKHDIHWTINLVLIFLIYSLFMSNMLDVNIGVAGFSQRDWIGEEGEFTAVGKLMGKANIFPLNVVLLWTIIISFVALMNQAYISFYKLLALRNNKKKSNLNALSK